MNEYNFNVKFEKGRITSNLKKLVQNDYNSTKINFTFDKEGRKVFKMLLPDGTPYVTNIENDELVFGKGVLSQDGTYEVEIALYTEDGRLTDYATVKFEVRAELIQTDEIIELDDRLPILDNLIQEATKIKTDAETGAFNGKDGKDGITPTIGTNGNWFIGMQDTGLPSRGEKGEKGESGGVSIEDVEEYVNNALENIDGGGSVTYEFAMTTELPTFDYAVQESYEVELNEEDVSNLEEFINIYAYEKCILNVNYDGMVLWTFTDTLANVEMLDETNFSLNLETKRIENVSLIINGTFDGTLYTVTDALLNIAMGDIDYINESLFEVKDIIEKTIPTYKIHTSNTHFSSDASSFNNKAGLSEILTHAYSMGYTRIALSVEFGSETGSNDNIVLDILSNNLQSQPKSVDFKTLNIASNRFIPTSLFSFTTYQLALKLDWTDDICDVTTATLYRGLPTILATNNTAAFTPTSNYQPATKKYVDDTVNDAIENIEITGGEGGEDPFIHLDLIVDYASAGSNPLPINSTKNTSELEKLSNLVNEYVANPKPILLSVFNSIGTVYKDHYNILVTTFGMAITATAKNPSLKYTILNGYKATPFTLALTGTWTDGVYTCTSASITYDNTKDLMGTTEFSTITGRKIFNTLPETNVKATSSSQFTNKQYVDDAIKNAITNVLEADY